MRKLAIISCKATKKTYSCKAEEMYSDSPQFKFQIPFINEYYDDYNILSVKYGVITKDTIIDTYNITLTKRSNMMSTNPTMNDKSKQRWATKIKKQIAQLSFEWDEIHLHLSEAYLKEIEEVLQIPNVYYIKLPNTLDTKANYLKFNKNGAAEGEPVFVVGNPGRTERYRTVSQLSYDRDFRYPLQYKFLKK